MTDSILHAAKYSDFLKENNMDSTSAISTAVPKFKKFPKKKMHQPWQYDTHIK